MKLYVRINQLPWGFSCNFKKIYACQKIPLVTETHKTVQCLSLWNIYLQVKNINASLTSFKTSIKFTNEFASLVTCFFSCHLLEQLWCKILDFQFLSHWLNAFCRWPASLLKMSRFHRGFSNILVVKTNYLVYP